MIQILRLRQVKARTGLGRSTIYCLVKEGKLKPPIKLGVRARGWLDTDVDEFIQSRIDASRPNVGGVKK